MREKHYWGWPIAGYLFLGGLGGGMTIVSTTADLFWDKGGLFALGNLIAAAALGIGSGLLIFELGRPLQFWRVFSTQRAVMTVGAWVLGLLIVTDFIYFTFWLPFLPWNTLVTLRQILSGFNLFLGIVVVTYTGVLLGSLKARPFWNSPALPVLFAVSGLSTGAAAQSLLAGVWPWQGGSEPILQAREFLHSLDAGFLVFEILILIVYIGLMRFSARAEAEKAATRWLVGAYAGSFWGGVVGFGLLLPLVLNLLRFPWIWLAPLCVFTGGIFLRFLVVFSDDRPQLPGEEKYRSRLPVGDEAFLK